MYAGNSESPYGPASLTLSSHLVGVRSASIPKNILFQFKIKKLTTSKDYQFSLYAGNSESPCGPASLTLSSHLVGVRSASIPKNILFQFKIKKLTTSKDYQFSLYAGNRNRPAGRPLSLSPPSWSAFVRLRFRKIFYFNLK